MIDFSLGPKVSGEDYLGPLHALELGRQAKTAETQMKLAQQRQANQQQVLQRYSAGDTQGAQQQAFASGDFDLAKHLTDNDETHRKALASIYDTIGSVSMQLKGLPQEQRAQAFARISPMLEARGVPVEELQKAGSALDDTTLDGYISTAQSVADQIKRHDEQAKFAETERHNRADETNSANNGYLTAGLLPPGAAPGTPALAGPMVSGSAPAGGKATGKFDSFYQGFLAPTEGGFADRDGASGAPVNFGVNQKANPDINVRNLTQQQAQQILHDRYWVPSGADKLPPGLAEIQGDTAVNMGVKTAQRLLQASGGDPERYLQLREARYRSIGGKDLGSWLNRNNSLRQYVGMQDGTPPARAAPGGPQIIPGGKLDPKKKDAPSGFRYKPDGQTLEPIPGGPADSTSGGGAKQSRAAEVSYRKEFDQLPEVKTFKTARTQFQTLKALGTKPNPTAQDDIAMIFGYMKTLDPTSVVREGEFATAQNAAGVPDTVRNAFNKALNGTRLNPEQRKNMVASAYENYKNYRDAYNQSAENYRSYARDSGVNPDHVARTYTPDKPQGRAVTSTITRVK